MIIINYLLYIKKKILNVDTDTEKCLPTIFYINEVNNKMIYHFIFAFTLVCK